MGFLDKLFGGKEEKPATPPPERAAPIAHQPGFPVGENVISDPDIESFTDLGRYYPLPAGFEYQQSAGGAPSIVRPADGQEFAFLIEEGMLSFDEPYTKSDGRRAFKTTEVIKRG